MRLLRRPHLGTAISALGFLACSGGESGPSNPPACGPGEPRLRLGTGQDMFQAVNDGDPILMVCGPQGGRHVLVRLRATGVDGDYSYEARLVDRDDGTQLAESRTPSGVTIPFIVAPDGCESDDLTVVFSATTADVMRREVALRARIKDTKNRTAEAEAEVVVDTSSVDCPG